MTDRYEQAGREAEAWLERLDPAVLATPDADASDLRAIAATKDALDATVNAALVRGRAWSPIAMALDSTRSDTQTRFGHLTTEARAEQRRRLDRFLAEHASDQDEPPIDDAEAEQALAAIHANSADLYVHVAETLIVRTDDLGRGVQIDYDEHGGVVGVELLDVESLTIEGRTRRLRRLPGARRLSDDELEAIDVDSVFANADLSDPSADASDLRAVTEAIEARRSTAWQLHEAVVAARRRGRTWSQIAGLFPSASDTE